MNLLQMSFSGAAFITAVVIIRAVAINKLPKKTFLVLWELVILRLLIPFSIPSMFSVYTLVTHSISSATLPETGTDYNIPTMQGLFVTTQGVEQPPADISSSVSMWFIVWCAGIILIALFFVISYLRCLIEFRTALPVHNHYVEKWLAERPLKRPILVRQSDRISAPLTYGIFRPVILMPKKMDWKNEKCVMILDESLPLGLIANTAAIMGITLGKQLPEVVGTDVVDRSGNLHLGIIEFPVPILRGSPETIKAVREKLYQPEFQELTVVDFSDLAQGCRTYGEYICKMEQVPEDGLQYFGVAICGAKKKVNQLTGSMPLLR